MPQLPPCVCLSLVLGSEVGLQILGKNDSSFPEGCFFGMNDSMIFPWTGHPNSASVTLQILKEVFCALSFFYYLVAHLLISPKNILKEVLLFLHILYLVDLV